MSKAVVRSATMKDIEEFHGKTPACAVSAQAAELGGRVVAIWGIFTADDGRETLFMDLSEEARKYPKSIVAYAKAYLASLGAGRHRAICNPEHPRAGRFLEYLGFKNIDGYVYEMVSD